MIASITFNYKVKYTFKSNDLISSTCFQFPIKLNIKNAYNYLDEIEKFIDTNYFIVACDEYKTFNISISNLIKEYIKNNLNIVDLDEVLEISLENENISIEVNCDHWGNKKFSFSNYFSNKTLKGQGLNDLIEDGMDGRFDQRVTFVGEMYKFGNGL